MNTKGRRFTSVLLILCVFFLSHLPAFAGENACLKYEPQVVELKGKVKSVVFPGPPNYESIEEGDKPETYWVLYLSKGICVQGDAKSELNSETEKGVKSLQLVMTGYDKYRPLLGKNVAVKGRLMHSFTGHHHTAVLIQVESISQAGQ